MTTDKLGHYRILDRIGAGGMGEVYRAHDEQLDRDVAIKVLPADRFTDATARARLLREARSAAALNHPHICTIYEVGESNGQAYIAMELIEGSPLSSLIERALPTEQIVRYGMQLAEALAHAHDRGVVHRDLKSSNVMITHDQRVKVLDFGLAKRLGSDQVNDGTTLARPETLTQPGTLVGTLAYMAPEQLRGQTGDVRSDIWAFGVILYEMSAGALPFRGQTNVELISAILTEPVPPLSSGIPQPLKSVIERCLDKAPARRFQAATEVRSGLASSAAFPAASRRSWLTAAAIVVAILATVSFKIFRDRSPFGSNTPHIQSLAVLPFENLSGDPSQEYFADGMTEALITDLGRLRGATRVIARSTVMHYKGSKASPADIARQLNVDALMTGAVVRSGDRVRVTAALVNPSTGEEVWTGNYERDLHDVLSLQSELTRAIVREIKGALTPQDAARVAAVRAVDPGAYEAYLKGRFHWYRMTPQDLDTARVYFERALQRDPNYAIAYVGLADAIATPAHFGLMPTTTVFPQARSMTLRALALDDTLPEAHDMLARSLFAWDWNWPAAEREFRRSSELNPNYPDAHTIYAQLLQSSGRLEQAIAEAHKAVSIDPQNPFFQAQLAAALAGAGRHDEAIAQYEKILAADSNSEIAHDGLWDEFFLKHRYDDALREAKKNFVLLGRQDVADALSHGYEKRGYSGAMESGAQALQQARPESYIGAISIARLYAHAGLNDSVLEWLQRAVTERDTRMVYVVGDPLYERVRRDPRFNDLVRRAQAIAKRQS